jgi:hypothetical protein
MTGYFPQNSCLETSTFFVIFYEIIFIKLHSSTMNQIHSSLNEIRIIFQLTEISFRRLSHSDIEISYERFLKQFLH